MSRGLGCGEGLRGYRPKGSGRLLSPKEEQEVQWLIQDPTPHPLKMYYALWTRPAVSDLIVVRYGVPLQVRTLDKHLKRWRYPPPEPLEEGLRTVARCGGQEAEGDLSGHIQPARIQCYSEH